MWPNFIIIGAAKAGTTSVYQYLLQHPDVYLPELKEPNFFAMAGDVVGVSEDDPDYESSIELFDRINQRSITDIAQYKSLFSGVKQEKAIGEASPFYLYHPHAPRRIKEHIPTVKLVALLRNPVERSYSSYLHLVREGLETRTFRQALLDEPYQSENVWRARKDYYIRPGFYSTQLNRYRESFDTEQLLVFLYEDLQSRGPLMMKEVFDFIGVDSDFTPDLSTRHNVSGVPLGSPLRKKSPMDQLKKTLLQPAQSVVLKNALRSALPSRWHGKLRNAYHRAWLDRPPLNSDDRNFLIDIFREDVLKLQDIVKRDLSGWLRAK